MEQQNDPALLQVDLVFLEKSLGQPIEFLRMNVRASGSRCCLQAMALAEVFHAVAGVCNHLPALFVDLDA